MPLQSGPRYLVPSIIYSLIAIGFKSGGEQQKIVGVYKSSPLVFQNTYVPNTGYVYFITGVTGFGVMKWILDRGLPHLGLNW